MLLQGIDFVRIGRNDAVHEEIRGHCFSGGMLQSSNGLLFDFHSTSFLVQRLISFQYDILTAMDIHSTEEIKVRLDQIKVVAVTCLGITSPLLVNKRFDVCIMDEAGQTTLPVCLRLRLGYVSSSIYEGSMV